MNRLMCVVSFLFGATLFAGFAAAYLHPSGKTGQDVKEMQKTRLLAEKREKQRMWPSP